MRPQAWGHRLAAPEFPRDALRARDRLREPAALRELDGAGRGHAVLSRCAVAAAMGALRPRHQLRRVRPVRLLRGVDRAVADAARPVALAVGVGALLSLTMETLQMFLPTRVANVADLLANTVGAALGGGLGMAFARSPQATRTLVATRDDWFLPGIGGRSRSRAAGDLAHGTDEPRHSAVRHDVRQRDARPFVEPAAADVAATLVESVHSAFQLARRRAVRRASGARAEARRGRGAAPDRRGGDHQGRGGDGAAQSRRGRALAHARGRAGRCGRLGGAGARHPAAAIGAGHARGDRVAVVVARDAVRAGPPVRARAGRALQRTLRPPAQLQRPHSHGALALAGGRQCIPVRARGKARLGAARNERPPRSLRSLPPEGRTVRFGRPCAH